jgi:ABC-type uncharacterized transport system permease subunit
MIMIQYEIFTVKMAMVDYLIWACAQINSAVCTPLLISNSTFKNLYEANKLSLHINFSSDSVASSHHT